MKKILLVFGAALFLLSAQAQEKPVYTFEVTKDNASTVTKDQCRTGTCWSYATSSFIESEVIRLGNGEHDLSEMFNVRVTYPKKAENYVRYQGKAQFGAGSLSHDVMNAVRDFGIVPDEVYTGLDDGNERHDHGEMDALLDGMIKGLVEKNKGSLSPNWIDAFASVLDVYLGEIPNGFDYKGKKYTPETFRDELGIVAADYMNFTSFTHHPFYTDFVIEVPDNFSQGSFTNVTIDELEAIVVNAIKGGYTIAWDADVSEKGFSFRNGLAIVPAEGVSKAQMFKEVVAEMEVTQENRQEGFDNQSTTDDHLMHLTGMATDQNGNKYFIIKNSWGTGNDYDGHQYISMAYFKLKTISIMVHKDAVPKGVQKNLGM